MITKICLALCALALIVPAWAVATAADQPASRTTGKILVLENEHILEGNIERQQDQYCIRRSVGETWIPAKTVLCLCADMKEAYTYVRSRANLRDPDERLRLARWCQLHGLRRQALAEIQAAVELRPNDPASMRLLHQLQETQLDAQRNKVGKSRPKAKPDRAVAEVEVSAETLGFFTSRVQPILMNTCAHCHASGKGGAFKLTRAFEDTSTNYRATKRNLAAVVAEINPQHPEDSLLLIKALSMHGDADKPPLRNRQTQAFRTLEKWVRMELSGSAPLEKASPSLPLSSMQPSIAVGSASPKTDSLPDAVRSLSEASEKWAAGRRTHSAQQAHPPAKGDPTVARPVDPFDPIIFNRQMHPELTKPTEN